MILAAAALALVLIPLAVFGLWRWAASGSVLGEVMAGPVTLSGLQEAEASAALVAHEDLLATLEQTYSIENQVFALDPTTVGFDVDEEPVIATAMQNGREGGFWSQFGWWLSGAGDPVVLDLPASMNDEALDKVLDVWEADANLPEPYDGAIVVDGVDPVAEYPKPGQGVDRAGVADKTLAALMGTDRPVIALGLNAIAPEVTVAQIDEGLAAATLLLEAPIELRRTDPDVTLQLSRTQLADAFVSEIVRESAPVVTVGFDPVVVDGYIEPIRADLEAPPRDAVIVVEEDDTVTIIPSRNGTLVDPDLAVEALVATAARADRIGVFPFQEGAEPELTTEEAEAMRINHLVSQFTTYHDCCAPRVTNIQLMADTIDGAVVMPGESFSINEFVGERTLDKGYKPAPTIIRGELEDTVGGGVSQFATTFYNAVFWGGYEDVDHIAHSRYFSRYPEGIEATISWPAPELIFRNNTDAAVLIKTAYTDRSITVKFFGDNGGRTIVGEQSRGSTKLEIVSEGIGARIVEGSVSGRYGGTSPPEEFIPDPTLEPGTQVVDRNGSTGWSVTVTRTITYPDGREVIETWPVRYRPQSKQIRVHPCDMPDATEECPPPSTTTTTVPGSSTTTPGSTTTTMPGSSTTTTEPSTTTTTTTTP